jgi:mannitol-specific phosphotransferase system IIBC component
MKRLGILLAFAVFGAALGTSGPASATEVSCWYNGGIHSCVWYPGYTLRGILVTPIRMSTPTALDLRPSRPRLWH